MRIVVGRIADFPPGHRRVVQAGRRSIGVFRVGDRFYALNNRCPHQGGPLCLGRTHPWLESTVPGDFRQNGETALLACPWHGWEYDLATGQSYLGAASVRHYQVAVESGDRAADAQLPQPYRGRIPGPYVAETFLVTVDDEYVVVDTTREDEENES